MFAVLSTLALSLGRLPWMGRTLAAARRRSIEEGRLDREGAEPMIPLELAGDDVAPGYTPHMLDFAAPLGTLLSIAIGSYLLTGDAWVNEAFSCAVLIAMTVAWARGMSLANVIGAFVSGCEKMTIGALVLGLAVTIGEVSKDLGTGLFVVDLLGGRVAPLALPAVLTALCMAIAFATGTSWGTYGVVFPLAMPLAWAIVPDPTFVQICFGAVLGGAVFGDQCSPISDTTILSSMFTGCDLVDHVRTQLPLALVSAGLGALASTVCVLLLV
jgi:Na+/H+ antiporter NhaC